MKAQSFTMLAASLFGMQASLAVCPGDGTNSTVVGEYLFSEGAGSVTINTGIDGDDGNASLTNGAVFSADVPTPNQNCGWSIQFPSTGSGSTTPAVESSSGYDPLSGAEAFTIMTWVRRQSGGSGSNQSARIFSDASSLALTSSTAGVELRFSGSSGTLALRVNGNEVGTTLGGIAPNSNVWRHVAVVYDGTRPATNTLTRNAHFYVDGIQRGDGNTLQGEVVGLNTSRVTLGNSAVSRGVGNILVGKLDNIMILRGFAPAAVGNGKTNAVIQCYMNINDDLEPPIINGPSNVYVVADLGQCFASSVPLGEASAADNCCVTVISNNAPSIFPVGVNAVTWIATDYAGNSSSCTQLVTVTDVESPAISCPPSITVTAGPCLVAISSLNLGQPTVTDNCGVASIVNVAQETFFVGATSVMWKAWDAAGNQSECSQSVVVEIDPTDDCNNNEIPDWWEIRYFGRYHQNNLNQDPDNDGVNNQQEYQAGTDPTKADSDDDGLSDGQELVNGTNPTNQGDPFEAPGVPPASLQVSSELGDIFLNNINYGVGPVFAHLTDMTVCSEEEASAGRWEGSGCESVPYQAALYDGLSESYTAVGAVDNLLLMRWHRSDDDLSSNGGIYSGIIRLFRGQFDDPPTILDPNNTNPEVAPLFELISPNEARWTIHLPPGGTVELSAKWNGESRGYETQIYHPGNKIIYHCPELSCGSIPVFVNAMPYVVTGDLAIKVNRLEPILGRLNEPLDSHTVRTLFPVGSQVGGIYEFTWDGLDDNGSPVPGDEYVVHVDWTHGAVSCGEDGDVLTVVNIEPIHFAATNDSSVVGVGSRVKLAVEVAPEYHSGEVVWTITERSDSRVICNINSASGELSIDERSIEGWAKVRAAYYEDSEQKCYSEAIVEIGCECTDCRSFGKGALGLGSVDAAFSLGSSDGGGGTAGRIILRSKTMSNQLASPAALSLSALGAGVKVYRQHGALRQILAPQTLADIVVESPYSYMIRFYSASDILSTSTLGPFQVGPGAQPVVTWRISNPDGETVATRLDVVEQRGGVELLNRYSFSSQDDSWLLDRPEDLDVRLTVVQEGGQRAECREMLVSGQLPASIQSTVYNTFPWGESVVRTVIDPDGLGLTNEFSYWQNTGTLADGNIKDTKSPDGAWAHYEYDAEGRITEEVRPWLDSPPGSAANLAWQTVYDYNVVSADDSERVIDRRRARTVIKYALGIEIGRTYHVFGATDDGGRVEITERAAQAGSTYGAAGNLREVTGYFPENSGSWFGGLVRNIHREDGLVDTYEYINGTYGDATLPGTFTIGSGDDRLRVVTHSTVGEPDGIPYRTTREREVLDNYGNVRQREKQVYTDTGYETVEWIWQKFDAAGHRVETRNSNGQRTEAAWGCCGKEWETDEGGITTTYSYDGAGRLLSETKAGITTTYHYDGAGRMVSQSRNGAGLILTSSNTYDRAGRITASYDSARRPTLTGYGAGGRITTNSIPGGAMTITESYLDGSTKSITGSAVVDTFFDNGVESDGTLWSKQSLGADDSQRWTLERRDFMGRVIRAERPGYGAVIVQDTSYDSQGNPYRVEHSGQKPRLMTYNELGEIVLNGMDVDENNDLDPAGQDRITGSDTRFVAISGSWWLETRTWTYPFDNDETEVNTAFSRRRLTGLGEADASGFAGLLTSETEQEDILGNKTITRIYTDRETSKVTTVTIYPDSSIPAVHIMVGGRLVEQISKTGVRTTYLYDGLGRQVEARTDSGEPGALRTVKQVTHYDDVGQVEYIEDADGNRTGFGYDASTGLRIAVTNAAGEATYTAYDIQGRVTNTWGAAYPVQYRYDEFGQMVGMVTFRDENQPGDLTTWQYDEATGLMVRKIFANGKGLSYAYNYIGELESRTSARGAVTMYFRDGIGQLVEIAYHEDDGLTPDLEFHYDRMGRAMTITDALGTRTNEYDPDTLQLSAEKLADGTLILHPRDALGRNAGLEVPGTGYDVNYAYDDVGRFRAITSSFSSVLGTVYHYVPGSDLLAGYSVTNYTMEKGLEVVRTYEPGRDLLNRIQNQLNGVTVSQYDYTYDNIGRRTNRQDAGAAFAATVNNDFTYNGRGEVIEAIMGENNYGFGYDSIGNRSVATNNGVVTTYQANELNQYTNIGSGYLEAVYDPDGNRMIVGNWLCTWDAENRLVKTLPRSVINGNKSYDYAYDYLGRRVAKTQSRKLLNQWIETWTKTYVYDGWNLIMERENDAGAITTNVFVWGLDISGSLQGAGGIGGLLATWNSFDGALSVPTYDGNGNVSEYLQDFEETSAHYEYDAYGNTIVADESAAGAYPFRFSTKYTDETGLLYYGFRYYNPQTGRWLNRDPFAERGGKNLYGFVGNRPIGFVDRLGLALYAFDGTGTDFDAWTHVSMLHRSYVGYKEYEEGVGSEWWSTPLGGGFGLGGANRLTSMYQKFVANYKRGDTDVDIIGFSRGSALAREFANILYTRGYNPNYFQSDVHHQNGRVTTTPGDRKAGCPVSIRFVGLFDTVGSFGLPWNQLNIGIRMDLPPNVKHAAHAIAQDERRREFSLTPLNVPVDGQVFLEQVFPGDHSDIGGGHKKDANLLSSAPLLFIWSAGRNVGVPFGALPTRPWPYKENLTPHDLTDRIIYTDGGPRNNLPGAR
jgi:RHS repeat-associated protein